MKKVLWVTGFKDIGRNQWPHSVITTNDYFEYFKRISTIENLICFSDKDTTLRIKEEIKHFPSNNLFDIEENIKYFYNDEAYLKEIQILKDPNFIDKVPYYLRPCMQYQDPNYNLINYSKCSLIRKASELFPDYTHYAWIDFGYSKTPEDIPPNKFYFNNVPHDKIYVSTLLKPDFDENNNPIYWMKQPSGIYKFPYDWTSIETLIKNPYRMIKGNMWFIPRSLTHWFENEMKISVNKQYNMNLICGYDEPLWLDIMARNFNLFKIDFTDIWRSWEWI